MFIYWGTKTFRKKEGIAADFCPLCRQPWLVDVDQIRQQSHVYGIGLGAGKVVGRVCRCQNCASEWVLQQGTIQGTIQPVGELPLDAVIAQTFPRLPVVFADRLEQEAQIAADPFSLDAPTRLGLIAEPFFILENDVQKQQSEFSLPRLLMGLCGLGIIMCAITGFAAFGSGAFLVSFLSLAAIGGLIFAMVKLDAGSSGKFMPRHIYPRLAACLAPLQPTGDELSTVLSQLREYRSARRTNLGQFLPVLQAAVDHLETTRVPIAARAAASPGFRQTADEPSARAEEPLS